MKIESVTARRLVGSSGSALLGDLSTLTDGHVLTVQADGTIQPEAAAAAGIGGSTGGVDNALLRADGTGGSTAQSSGITVADAASGVAEMTAARLVRGVRTISSSPDTQLASDDLLLFSAALTVDLLTTCTTGRAFSYLCTSAATLTLDPGGTDTINGGGAGAALAIACAAGQQVELVRSAAGAWRAVLPVLVDQYRVRMYPSGSDMLVALERKIGAGDWTAIKGPTAVSMTAGTSLLGCSVASSLVHCPSGYATAADQPLEGDRWIEPLDGTGVLGVTWTPASASRAMLVVSSDQPTQDYYGIGGYMGHKTPGSGPGIMIRWGRSATTKVVSLSSDNNNDGGSAPTATQAGPAYAFWTWLGSATVSALGWGQTGVSTFVADTVGALPSGTVGTMGMGAVVVRGTLGGTTVDATLDVALYPAAGELSW